MTNKYGSGSIHEAIAEALGNRRTAQVIAFLNKAIDSDTKWFRMTLRKGGLYKRWNQEIDGKKETTTEPPSLAAPPVETGGSS